MPETNWSDAALWAFVDGEAAPAEARAILAAERSDAALAERIRELREAQAELAEAMDEVLAEPVPEALTRAVMDAPAGGGNVVAFPQRRAWIGPVLAMAATVALAVGLGAGLSEWRVGQRLDEMAARSSAEQAILARVLQEGLERRRSGEIEVGADADFAAQLTPVRTYKSESGHWCREFTENIRRGGEDYVRRGVACRFEDGWRRVETVIEGEEAGRRL